MVPIIITWFLNLSSSYMLRTSTLRTDHTTEITVDSAPKKLKATWIMGYRCFGREIRHVNERKVKGDLFRLAQAPGDMLPTRPNLITSCIHFLFLIAIHLRWYSSGKRAYANLTLPVRLPG
jgi:hypothetical protein